MHSARSATPPAAAKLRAGQLQMITKNPQQRCVALAVKRYFLGVNSKADHVLLPSCSRSAANQSYIIAIDARIHCTVQRDEACQIHGEASLSREQESAGPRYPTRQRPIHVAGMRSAPIMRLRRITDSHESH